MNDFAANGYGVLDLDANKEIETIYTPKDPQWTDDSVKLVLGIGTGLGACQLTKPVYGNYHVNPLECGM